MRKRLSAYIFIAALLVLWIVSDIAMVKCDSLKYFDVFPKNDYDITRIAHPEEKWDKVFFGSSVVVASYVEDKSDSGYINFGIDYGTVSDIYKAMKKGIADIEGDLVVGLNDISFLDSLDTNATYPWHKKWYQHYIYFERDNIYPVVNTAFDNLLSGKNLAQDMPSYKNPQKYLYTGALTEEKLQESNKGMIERFGGCTTDDCKQNFGDLEKLIRLCRDKGIRLRFVWMPWNPKIPVYDFALEVMDEANQIFKENNIDVFDMTHMMDSKHFYDIGHMSYPEGAEEFTRLVDKFLMQ